MMGIFTKGINKGAYQGRLTCPHLVNVKGERDPFGSITCESTAIRHIEDITPMRLRYRCRKCGGTFQYDISGIHNNPYAPFQKGTIQRTIERVLSGRQLKGAIQ